MSEQAIELQRKRVAAANHGEVELPSGVVAGLELPNLKKQLLSGNIPLPVLAMMQKGREQLEDDLDLDKLKELDEYNDGLIRQTVKTFDGEPVDLTGIDMDEVFTVEDQADLTAYIQRNKKLPGKA